MANRGKGLLLAAACVAGFGCQTNALMTAKSQACVENALRRSASAEMASTARDAFADGCAEGEMEACSALGVLTEVGFGRSGDPFAAAQLYGRACDGGNGRACANLGLLLERGKLGPTSVTRALPFYTRACNGDDALGCTELARLYRDGVEVVKNAGMAATMFDKACSAGEARACTASAELMMARDPAAALAAFTRACLAGEAEACERLGGAPPRGLLAEARAPRSASAEN